MCCSIQHRDKHLSLVINYDSNSSKRQTLYYVGKNVNIKGGNDILDMVPNAGQAAIKFTHKM
jgi:hypothetical protein